MTTSTLYPNKTIPVVFSVDSFVLASVGIVVVDGVDVVVTTFKTYNKKTIVRYCKTSFTVESNNVVWLLDTCINSTHDELKITE